MDVEEITQQLKEHACRLTPQRRMIVQALLASSEPLTAQQVHSSVSRTFPNISFDTVYRNLGLLSRLGIVNRINLKVKFNCRFELAQEHRHHFICLSCGSSFPVSYCPFEHYSSKAQTDTGFRVVDHAFEVYGYCAGCNVGNHVDLASAVNP
ncbi:MAG: Fur family transcriptional regulator [Eubacteriales bacterium]|jgi:Fe2+ or Zn2+ uptake regulation protein|nr:transcriptional repressor [Bacillota bacterium]MBV1727090.1 transcriptional repressor [Desulforudis sp.]MDQ7789517.1 Fur family transcriptional regulator [Clostridia bacterium]MDZ4043838.1 Fur family transcriptional regulator [Eubacteriales bacterium]MBU4533356.1 transcriptional repressor [Bacillota bacterium]